MHCTLARTRPAGGPPARAQRRRWRRRFFRGSRRRQPGPGPPARRRKPVRIRGPASTASSHTPTRITWAAPPFSGLQAQRRRSEASRTTFTHIEGDNTSARGKTQPKSCAGRRVMAPLRTISRASSAVSAQPSSRMASSAECSTGVQGAQGSRNGGPACNNSWRPRCRRSVARSSANSSGATASTRSIASLSASVVPAALMTRTA